MSKVLADRHTPTGMIRHRNYGREYSFKVINHLRPAARLALDLAQAPAMIAVATAIALASAVAVAWRPTHARPLEVLRQEG